MSAPHWLSKKKMSAPHQKFSKKKKSHLFQHAFEAAEQKSQ